MLYIYIHHPTGVKVLTFVTPCSLFSWLFFFFSSLSIGAELLYVGSQDQRLACVDVLTSGLIWPQLVPWYWSSPSTASKCDQLEPERFGQIKQTCCFDFCRLSAWYSDGGVSLFPTSGVTPCWWSLLLTKLAKLLAVL